MGRQFSGAELSIKLQIYRCRVTHKNETSETNVRNLFWLFSFIYDPPCNFIYDPLQLYLWSPATIFMIPCNYIYDPPVTIFMIPCNIFMIPPATIFMIPCNYIYDPPCNYIYDPPCNYIYDPLQLLFMIPCNYKLLSFFTESINKPYKDHIHGRRLYFNLWTSYLKSFKSSLQPHHLRVNLVLFI